MTMTMIINNYDGVGDGTVTLRNVYVLLLCCAANGGAENARPENAGPGIQNNKLHIYA